MLRLLPKRLKGTVAPAILTERATLILAQPAIHLVMEDRRNRRGNQSAWRTRRPVGSAETDGWIKNASSSLMCLNAYALGDCKAIVVLQSMREAQMQWLSENWFWIVIGLALFFLMQRMHGHGMGHRRGYRSARGYDDSSHDRTQEPRAVFDPVSRNRILPGGTTISSAYDGRAYYFENRPNRDAFESDPDKYLAAMPESGLPIDDRRHRRRGC